MRIAETTIRRDVEFHLYAFLSFPFFFLFSLYTTMFLPRPTIPGNFCSDFFDPPPFLLPLSFPMPDGNVK